MCHVLSCSPQMAAPCHVLSCSPQMAAPAAMRAAPSPTRSESSFKGGAAAELAVLAARCCRAALLAADLDADVAAFGTFLTAGAAGTSSPGEEASSPGEEASQTGPRWVLEVGNLEVWTRDLWGAKDSCDSCGEALCQLWRTAELPTELLNAAACATVPAAPLPPCGRQLAWHGSREPMTACVIVWTPLWHWCSVWRSKR